MNLTVECCGICGQDASKSLIFMASPTGAQPIRPGNWWVVGVESQVLQNFKTLGQARVAPKGLSGTHWTAK